jgi:hypothetical protein
MERGRANPMLPAKIRRLQSRLVLLQDPDDRLFGEAALLHPGPLLPVTRELQLAPFLLIPGSTPWPLALRLWSCVANDPEISVPISLR